MQLAGDSDRRCAVEMFETLAADRPTIRCGRGSRNGSAPKVDAGSTLDRRHRLSFCLHIDAPPHRLFPR